MTVLEQHLDQEVEPTGDALVFTSATGARSTTRAFVAASTQSAEGSATKRDTAQPPRVLRLLVAETDGVLEAARRLGHATTSITTRPYAPMRGGDRTVADRLDRARQAAKATGDATEVARTWHDGQPEASSGVTPKRAHPG